MFNKYPYTDFHELNLDWFLAKYKGLFDDISQLKTIYDMIGEMHATKHYYTIREWLHIHNQVEFQAYLDLFNAGFTSLNCYIDSPGVYKFEDKGSGFPVFNGVQMHIYSTAGGISLDLNGMTFYNGHLVIDGTNGNISIIDTNDVDRQEYIEGGQAFYKNCDWYCTSRSWYSNITYSNCNWYEVSSWAGTCIDVLGSSVILKDGCGFLFTHSDNYPNYGIFGIGVGGNVTTRGRLTIASPASGSHRFITRRQDGVGGDLRFYSSCVNPATNRSYLYNERGNFTEFSNLFFSNLYFESNDERFRYLTLADPTISGCTIDYNADLLLDNYDKNAVTDLPYASLSMFLSIGVVGDSFANGYTVHGGTRINNPTLSWLQNIARRNGITGHNYAWSGLDTRNWLTSAYGLTALQAESPDNLYFLCLGINDSTHLADIGTPADIITHADTFYGNYATIIEDIIAHAPNAKLIMVDCMRYNTATAEINAAIYNIAEHYAIPCIHVRDDEYMNSGFYLSDQLGALPTIGGYASISRAIERLFYKCYFNNKTYFDDMT